MTEDRELLDLVRQGKKVRAVAWHRERFGSSLREAKDAVEQIQHEMEGVLPSPELHGQVDALLHQGKFIEAIKLHRQMTHTDLKDSKEAIEARAKELGLEPNLSFFGFLRGLWRR
ncbi:MAG: hypothetical protein M9921_13790 [Fimbriimonadaceae bacterium]|nr:hypothetical protein [Fimbriimonadaceae bacterium]